MKKIKMLGGAMLASMVAANAYASCITGTEAAALETSALQQELMVAAFTCRDTARYNQFVLAHRPELQRADATVKAFFIKRGKGEAGYHSFKTDLANSSAVWSARADSFCADADDKFSQARSGSSLGGIATASLSGYRMCPGVVREASVRTEPRNTPYPARARDDARSYEEADYDRGERYAGRYAARTRDEEPDYAYAEGAYGRYRDDDRYGYRGDDRYERDDR